MGRETVWRKKLTAAAKPTDWLCLAYRVRARGGESSAHAPCGPGAHARVCDHHVNLVQLR